MLIRKDNTDNKVFKREFYPKKKKKKKKQQQRDRKDKVSPIFSTIYWNLSESVWETKCFKLEYFSFVFMFSKNVSDFFEFEYFSLIFLFCRNVSEFFELQVFLQQNSRLNFLSVILLGRIWVVDFRLMLHYFLGNSIQEAIRETHLLT